MKVAILPCSRCGYETLIHHLDLQGITVHQIGLSREGEYVNFVCPECGLGREWWTVDIPLRSVEHPSLRRTPLLGVSLRCVEEHCEAHARMHTVLDSDKSNAEPRIKVRDWTVDRICCPLKHAIKQPIEIISQWRPNCYD
jgi:hypothetical protein